MRSHERRPFCVREPELFADPEEDMRVADEDISTFNAGYVLSCVGDAMKHAIPSRYTHSGVTVTALSADVTLYVGVKDGSISAILMTNKAQKDYAEIEGIARVKFRATEQTEHFQGSPQLMGMSYEIVESDDLPGPRLTDRAQFNLEQTLTKCHES